ncbi:hypothetical protein FRB95_011356 [Tulasnella sp. JGI-2019a]|nr:hypothetical protein FRB95_011356 [Tulasnella sp. JGI-2019a]
MLLVFPLPVGRESFCIAQLDTWQHQFNTDLAAQHPPDMDSSDKDRQAPRTALEILGTYRIDYNQLEIDMDSLLGQGGFGVVRRARFEGQVVAVKILRSDESRDIRVAKASSIWW